MRNSFPNYGFDKNLHRNGKRISYFKLIYTDYYIEIPSSTALLDITLLEIQKNLGNFWGLGFFLKVNSEEMQCLF